MTVRKSKASGYKVKFLAVLLTPSSQKSLSDQQGQINNSGALQQSVGG